MSDHIAIPLDVFEYNPMNIALESGVVSVCVPVHARVCNTPFLPPRVPCRVCILFLVDEILQVVVVMVPHAISFDALIEAILLNALVVNKMRPKHFNPFTQIDMKMVEL